MTSPTCEIRWFDETGAMPIDNNPSIGPVRTKECDYTRPRGGTVHLRASPWFHICAEHARWLVDAAVAEKRED